eukprot:scaffold40929_cov56-Phaeocystis_antarctica.AAC.4
MHAAAAAEESPRRSVARVSHCPMLMLRSADKPRGTSRSARSAVSVSCGSGSSAWSHTSFEGWSAIGALVSELAAAAATAAAAARSAKKRLRVGR